MSIELHCPQCEKLIRAPDEAGGRRGKCPYCKNSVYIPTPPDESEAIGLAPLDIVDEEKAEALRRESTKFASLVDHETDSKGISDVSTTEQDAPVIPIAAEDVDPAVEVESFIAAMRDSRLDDADAAADRLKTAGRGARKYVRSLIAEGTPPAVENVPPPVVAGFLKSLKDRLG